MQAPPVLTAERIDAMLSIVAEVCLESVVEAGQRQKAAADDEGFERCGRSLQGACRNLRQTIAMKQRFDREEAQKAADARRLDAETRQEAAREREAAVSRRRAQLRVRLRHDIWNEYEPEEADDLCDGLDACLRDLTREDDFLDAPLDTLLQRLTHDLGLDEADREPPSTEAPPSEPSPPCGERVGSGGVGAEPEGSHPHPRPLPARGRGGADTPPQLADTRPDPPGPVAESPPPPPPDPTPEPYIPPWEKLRPGQIMPGGTGW